MLKSYVGSCVNSFDENGHCIVGQLPWTTVTDFSQAGCRPVSREWFTARIDGPAEVMALLKQKNDKQLTYLAMFSGEIVLYDEEADIHYFFA